MTNESLSVPEVHCDHCVSSIEGAVAAVDGVNEVKVQLEERTVEVSFDDVQTDLDTIVSTIEDQGYEVAS